MTRAQWLPKLLPKLQERGLFLILSLAITLATFAFVIWVETKLSG